MHNKQHVLILQGFKVGAIHVVSQVDLSVFYLLSKMSILLYLTPEGVMQFLINLLFWLF